VEWSRSRSKVPIHSLIAWPGWCSASIKRLNALLQIVSLPKGERSAGDLQKGDVSRLTWTSQRTNSSLSGLSREVVSRSGDRRGMSLHLVPTASSDCGLSVGAAAGLDIFGDSLASVG